MAEVDLTALNIDAYDTKTGPWNPDHGDIEIPDDWDFLPSGDTFVNRRVTQGGVYWIEWRPRSRRRGHRRRIGLWAPAQAIAAAEAARDETAEQRTKARAQAASTRARAESRYEDELRRAILEFLAFDPHHEALAEEIAGTAAARAAVVGSGRVGRTRTIMLEERAALAARAHIRHHHTNYHDELDTIAVEWDDEYLYRRVKRPANEAVDEFLARHRSP